MVAVLEDRSAKFGKWTWDLNYAQSALICISRAAGGLNKFAKLLIQDGQIAGLTPDTAAILVWAGQAHKEPKLTLEKTKRRLEQMTDTERGLLSTWAAADFLKATLGIVANQVAKMTPAEADDDD